MALVSKKATAPSTPAPVAAATPAPAKGNHVANWRACYATGLFVPGATLTLTGQGSPWGAHKPGLPGYRVYQVMQQLHAANPKGFTVQAVQQAVAAAGIPGTPATGLSKGVTGHLAWFYTSPLHNGVLLVNGVAFGQAQPASAPHLVKPAPATVSA